MKKHTKNVWTSLEDLAISTCYKSQRNYQKLVEDAGTMRGKGMNDSEAFKMLGLLFGNDILSPRQLPVVRDNWLKPPYEEFQPRNMFSFYNACTEALKTSPPMYVMERHIQLHNTLNGEVWL